NLTGTAAQLVRLSTAVDNGDIEGAPIRPRFRGGRAAFRYILDARSSLLCRFGGDPCVRARYTIGNAGRDGRKAGARLAVFPRSADDRRPDLRAGCFPLVDGPAGGRERRVDRRGIDPVVTAIVIVNELKEGREGRGIPRLAVGSRMIDVEIGKI